LSNILNLFIYYLITVITISVYLPVSFIWTLAKPISSSKAASEIFKSDFHEEINLWHTKYVALTYNAWAESKRMITYFLYYYK